MSALLNFCLVLKRKHVWGMRTNQFLHFLGLDEGQMSPTIRWRSSELFKLRPAAANDS